jgi:two-component system, OmpR family, sensor histidine kinase CreC
MKIWVRIALAILILFGVAFSYFTKVEMEETKRRYREATEEPLVDVAHILAGIVAAHSISGAINYKSIGESLASARQFQAPAQIYELSKSGSDIEVTVTNEYGVVLFDSAQPSNIGADYSRWNDIFLTLRGEYGARSSIDPVTGISTLHVAAPIQVLGKRIGALSVRKSNKNTNRFIFATQKNIKQLGLLLFAIIALTSILILYWVTRPITCLTEYVRKVRDQQPTILPKLPQGEIGDLGIAFEELREALEGRKYIERYVTTLTHELKSPITAIRGALEILSDDIPHDKKALFLSNIEREVIRIQGLVEKLLALSSLQNRRDVDTNEIINVKDLVTQIKDTLALQLVTKNVTLKNGFNDSASIQGNNFWIREALLNLVQNAIDFTPSGSIITIHAQKIEDHYQLCVEDQGEGVPEWAMAKIFNQFFSLPRPESGKRSSGLGLSIVSEVAKLHHGRARIEKVGGRGTRAILEIEARV